MKSAEGLLAGIRVTSGNGIFSDNHPIHKTRIRLGEIRLVKYRPYGFRHADSISLR